MQFSKTTKIALAVILAVAAFLFLSGCTSSEPSAPKTVVAETTQPATTPTPVEEAPAMENLTGKWAFTDGSFSMNAEVSTNAIQVNLVLDDAEGLYWAGTFVPEAENGSTVVSKAEVDALARSLFGSQDKTKAFEYDDGALQFKFTMMGVTKTIKLEHQ